MAIDGVEVAQIARHRATLSIGQADGGLFHIVALFYFYGLPELLAGVVGVVGYKGFPVHGLLVAK